MAETLTRERRAAMRLAQWPRRYLNVGAIQDQQAGYVRRAFRSIRRRSQHPIWCKPWQGRGIGVMTFRLKAARGQLAPTPIGAAAPLGS